MNNGSGTIPHPVKLPASATLRVKPFGGDAEFVKFVCLEKKRSDSEVNWDSLSLFVVHEYAAYVKD